MCDVFLLQANNACTVVFFCFINCSIWILTTKQNTHQSLWKIVLGASVFLQEHCVCVFKRMVVTFTKDTCYVPTVLLEKERKHICVFLFDILFIFCKYTHILKYPLLFSIFYPNTLKTILFVIH